MKRVPAKNQYHEKGNEQTMSAILKALLYLLEHSANVNHLNDPAAAAEARAHIKAITATDPAATGAPPHGTNGQPAAPTSQPAPAPAAAVPVPANEPPLAPPANPGTAA